LEIDVKMKKTPRQGVPSLIPVRVVLGHHRVALHVAIKRVSLYQPGSADHRAAFSHHAAQMLNVVLELFGSLFNGYKTIQIW
jgi:hypothetical protein